MNAICPGAVFSYRVIWESFGQLYVRVITTDAVIHIVAYIKNHLVLRPTCVTNHAKGAKKVKAKTKKLLVNIPEAMLAPKRATSIPNAFNFLY